MKQNRISYALAAALVGTVALVGCKKKEEPVVAPPAGSDESALTFVSYLLVELQPHLGRATPTFLRDWPSCMTSGRRATSKVPARSTTA